MVAVDPAGSLVGSLQCWDLALAGAGPLRVPLVLVGPVAVAPEAQGTGIGTRMLGRLLERAGARTLMLVGDPGYYGRFGFSAAPTGKWLLPGPVERHRLLARVAPGVSLPDMGRVEPASTPLRRAG